MTQPSPEGLEREGSRLWVTDAEMIRRLGPREVVVPIIRMLDRNCRTSGFPQKEKLWGDRRYWPAVKAYFDSQYGIRVSHPTRRAVNE